jgi:hypothetical protein
MFVAADATAAGAATDGSAKSTNISRTSSKVQDVESSFDCTINADENSALKSE